MSIGMLLPLFRRPVVAGAARRGLASGPSGPAGLKRGGSRVQIAADTDPDLKSVLEANRTWVDARNKEDATFFKRLGAGQQPKYLYFGCSDSRVPANEIMGLEPGEVFVHRNVGNLVPGNDLNSLSVLQYAVEVLDVKHIIVAGHYDCGAVRAAVKTHDAGLIENWLRGIRDVYVGGERCWGEREG